MGSKRIGRPPGSNGEVSRRQIVEIAVRRLAQSGYASTTVKQIAAEAGVTTGAVYHYFPSKTDLVKAVYSEGERALMAEYEAAIDDDAPLVDNIIRILDCVRSQSDSYMRNLSAITSSLVVEAARHPELEAILTERNAFEEVIRRLVLKAVARGETDPALDAQSIVDLLMTLFQGLSARLAWPITIARHKRTIDAAERLLRCQLFVMSTPRVDNAQRGAASTMRKPAGSSRSTA